MQEMPAQEKNHGDYGCLCNVRMFSEGKDKGARRKVPDKALVS